MIKQFANRVRERAIRALTQHHERHGLQLSMYIETAPLDEAELWPQLFAALDLIAEYRPVWINRMIRLGNSVHIRRIPGTRAMLSHGRYTILDPYLLADFLPAQIAASIVHEATHALLEAKGVPFDPQAPWQHERVCRRAEVRFGRALLAAGVEGAEAVLDRAEGALLLPDEDVGVIIDQDELHAIRVVTRLRDLPLPTWCKRRIARRRGVSPTAFARLHDIGGKHSV